MTPKQLTTEQLLTLRAHVAGQARPVRAAAMVAGAMVDVMIGLVGEEKTAAFLAELAAHVAAGCPPQPDHGLTDI